jgi:RNA-directed DNA polymerase
LRSYFDTVRHHFVLEKVARRVDDDTVLWLLKLLLDASGKQGVPQGGVISPLLTNLYLNEGRPDAGKGESSDLVRAVDGGRICPFADDLVILMDSHPRQQWLRQAVERRLREELAKLLVEVNEEKSRKVDLQRGESFGFLGFEFPRVRNRRGRWMPLLLPKSKKRTALLGKLKEIFRASRSQPVGEVIEKINPILPGWVKYFAIGHSSRCFSYIREQATSGPGVPTSRIRLEAMEPEWLYDTLGLFSEYRVSHQPSASAVAPVR